MAKGRGSVKKEQPQLIGFLSQTELLGSRCDASSIYFKNACKDRVRGTAQPPLLVHVDKISIFLVAVRTQQKSNFTLR